MATFDGAGDDPIRPMLRPGERILWRGQPAVAAFALRGAWYAIPFSIAWAGFAIFWEVSVLTSGAGGIFFALWGVPFVLLGLYLVFGRLIVARAEARRTHYAITDQRVLIAAGSIRRRVVEMALDDVPAAQLELGSGDLGQITFGTGASPLRLPPGWPVMGMYARPPAFESIRDARRAYRVLQDAKAESRRG